jgi:hypothetical protein
VDRSSVLGTAVLAYALLTSGTLLFIKSGWPDAVNSAIWLAYVAGGLGLLRRHKSGRALTLLAASASLLVMLLVSANPDLELNFYSPVWLMGVAPPVALLIGALMIKPQSKDASNAPATSDVPGASLARRRRHRDIAYGSFSALGLIGTWTALLMWDDPEDGVLGFLVVLPFGIPVLLGLALGLGFSLAARDDARLVVLSLFTIAMAGVLVLLDLRFWVIPLAFYSAVCLQSGFTWFFKFRIVFEESASSS